MTIDPALLPAIARNRAAWPVPGHELPLHEWRERYERQVVAARPPWPAGVTTEDHVVGPLCVRVRIYRPVARGTLAALVYFHGGGWVIGSVETHDDITAAIAHDAGVVVVSVDYSRAPEHPYPRAFDEGRSVVAWLRSHAAHLGVDPLRCFVGGDSAGGNLSLACAMAARDDAIPLAGQALLYPCVDTDFSRRSYLDEADAPFMSGRQMQWFWDQYAPSNAARSDCFAVPMRATDAQLRRLAPAFVATAQHDCLFDEGRALADRLRAAGVPVHDERGTGLVHGFVRLRTVSAEAARIYGELVTWIRRVAAS